ncbi:purine-nucleoside phosphorylase [Novisyntrophococcus fermenticellae]|uniref:purine-nucleoside phosphorylase n=1 Tax=Novisyntrophococcus fermenticellae TaxID=2068655 RepID=UPI001E30F400|nr:purine-nucleoside phosphorylase [Novisyntrophococcus fermenticellae]
MNQVYEKLMKCHESLRGHTQFEPEIAMVLGSGLGSFADKIKVEDVLDYKDIEGFPVSTVAGHKGRFVFGYIGDIKVVIMQGRVHYYEGYEMSDVVLPTRLMKLMGAGTLFLTNAAGSINYGFKAGDFMLIRDHIMNFVPSPLIGPNIDELGCRFPDMAHIYDESCRQVIKDTALAEGIPLKEGIYIQLSGPNFETPSEVRMCRMLGADAAGMSTACEAVAAHHMGMKVCGISCMSNVAADAALQPLTHEEVQETMDKKEKQFTRLITACVRNLAKER